MKKIILPAVVTMLAVATVALGTALFVVCRRVDAFDRKYGCDVLANLARANKEAESTSVKGAARNTPGNTAAASACRVPPEMKILNVSYGGGNEIVLTLSHRPDMDTIRNYIKVTPLVEGNLIFGQSVVEEQYDGGDVTELYVKGEFPYRTDMTLRVLKGMPRCKTGIKREVAHDLKEDFVHTFRRKDREPYVKFADPGRYLPPGGLGAIAFEAVNVTNLSVGVCRVEPHNLVQMLAREESVYSNYLNWYGSAADRNDTAELAGEIEKKIIRCANRANEKEKIYFHVSMNDGRPRNGIYLVNALMADFPERCRSYCSDSEVANPARYRVVCISDLGLSVRRWGKDKVGVWVTSLTTGRPVANTEISIYSPARIKVMEGVTDANGWCEPKRIAGGKMFALVAVAPSESDMTFMALRNSMIVDETQQEGSRRGYLGKDETAAFLWTERGIYRHGEKIFVHAIFRNGSRTAPRPFPVELQLVSPKGDILARDRIMTDKQGAIRSEKFYAPSDSPSGTWKIKVVVPGGKKTLGERIVKIEEFAPPQIRVKVDEDDSLELSKFGFAVSAEYLFGGQAKNLPCEGAVVFEDAPFAPANWKGWNFGNEMRGLKPSFRRLDSSGRRLDGNGTAAFLAPFLDSSGLPKATVRVTAQGTVIEDGGRPASARKSCIRHFYPFYIGSTMPGRIKLDEGGRPAIRLACVAPDGKRVGEPKKLTVKIERIDLHYSYKEDKRGWATWNCERVHVPVVEGVAIESAIDKDTVYELPLDECGDYAITISDTASRSSFGREFYLGDQDNDEVRAPLSDPTKVSITPDKAFYRVGERPRLAVKAPFAGWALLSVMHDSRRYTEVISLTNATTEITMRPVEAADAPNLNVYLSVIQGVNASSKRLAVRARGQATVLVRPAENEIAVSVKGRVDIGDGGSSVAVEIDAPNASDAVVTLVDEGVNLLTGEATPDPSGFFAASCQAEHPLYDIYHRVLPVVNGDALKISGVKTGGGCSGFGNDMLSRVSPVSTRRFKPLALWKGKVPVVGGKAKAKFRLPEFVGEVRVCAVAYNECATGSSSVQLKVAPRLVAMPDAPRFAAPKDRFDLTMPVFNRSGADGRFSFEIAVDGDSVALVRNVFLAKDASTNIVCGVTAPDSPGEMKITYTTRGFDETHVYEIVLPVRPAVAWRETAGVRRLAPGEKFEPQAGRFSYREYDSPVGDLARSLEWLCEYPHGCLEQTVSRVFPLLAAGGILSGVKVQAKQPHPDVVSYGVKRVESMVREHDFVMWPDVSYAPWDREVSLYASHFLIYAEKSGVRVSDAVKKKVRGFLAKWAVSTNNNESAYALHTLALAGRSDKDQMFRLYDARERLSLLSRARLASAFAEIGDRERAKTLLANALSPASVKEAAFAVFAMLELDPADARILELVKYLQDRRDRSRYCWGTTGENAHALMAIAEYYRYNPPKKGEKFVAWRKLELPKVEDSKVQSNGLAITRRFLSSDGNPVDTAALKRGEMVYSQIVITSAETRELSDLVIEDLLAGAMEPVLSVMGRPQTPAWVMRYEARDDRMLVFSERFTVEAGEKIVFTHPMRVVSAGQFTLPGVSVEAMYFPSLNARSAPGRVVSR